MPRRIICRTGSAWYFPSMIELGWWTDTTFQRYGPGIPGVETAFTLLWAAPAKCKYSLRDSMPIYLQFFGLYDTSPRPRVPANRYLCVAVSESTQRHVKCFYM